MVGMIFRALQVKSFNPHNNHMRWHDMSLILIPNLWVWVCFGIQNFSDLRR